jgi:N-hydroxyarylamine O-acetyltransferase
VRFSHYLARIGVPAAAEPSHATLRRLHVAHRETFLFENLSIQEGGGISVALPDLERKFLDERRGGYCFEHNTLFAAALRESGFVCDALLGRVRRGPPEAWARTHMVIAVQVQASPRERSVADAVFASEPAAGIGDDGGTAERWLADVGFGAIGLVEPIPLRDGALAHDRGLTYSLRRERHLWVLAMRDASGHAMDLYEFSDEPQTAGDVVIANHFTATHPDSIFRRSLTIQGVRGTTRTILRSTALTVYEDGVLREQPVADRHELAALARDLFGIDLPETPLVYESYAPLLA